MFHEEVKDIIRETMDLIRIKLKSGYKIVDIDPQTLRILFKRNMLTCTFLLLKNFEDYDYVFEVSKLNNCVRYYRLDGYNTEMKKVCDDFLHKYYIKKIAKVKSLKDFDKLINDFPSI